MPSLTYSEKLKDRRWLNKRTEILIRDGFSCVECRKENSNLEVHHLDYIYGIEPWDYPNDMLVSLCPTCHEKERARTKVEKVLLTTMKMKGFMLGDLLSLSCKIDSDKKFTEILLKAIRNA